MEKRVNENRKSGNKGIQWKKKHRKYERKRKGEKWNEMKRKKEIPGKIRKKEM